MKGIILLSHGPLAKGMYETSGWFIGESEQYGYLCLENQESPESYKKRIEDKIAEVDTGEGVVLIVDLLGGTPCLCCTGLVSDKVQVIAGMNLAMVLQLLCNRLSDNYDYDELIEASREAIMNVNSMIE